MATVRRECRGYIRTHRANPSRTYTRPPLPKSHALEPKKRSRIPALAYGFRPFSELLAGRSRSSQSSAALLARFAASWAALASAACFAFSFFSSAACRAFSAACRALSFCSAAFLWACATKEVIQFINPFAFLPESYVCYHYKMASLLSLPL